MFSELRRKSRRPEFLRLNVIDPRLALTGQMRKTITRWAALRS
jgi:hypothetical protein